MKLIKWIIFLIYSTLVLFCIVFTFQGLWLARWYEAIGWFPMVIVFIKFAFINNRDVIDKWINSGIHIYVGTFILIDMATYKDSVQATNKLEAWIKLKYRNSLKLLKIEKI